MDRDRLKMLKSRSVGERYADTFTFLRLNLGLLVKTHMLLSLPVILLTAGLFVLLFPSDFSLLRTIDSGPFVDTVAQSDRFGKWLIQTWFNFAACLPIAANTLIVMDLYAKSESQKVPFEQVVSSFMKNFPKLYLAKVIMGALIVISSFFLVIPAFVFYTMFMCVELLILQHQFGVFRALGRSWSIMSKSFSTSFFVNLGLFAIFGVIWLALQGMGPLYEYLASFLMDEVRSDGTWMIVGRALGIFNAVIGYCLYMIPAAGAGIQYFALREEISKTDILQRIREIGLKNEPKPYDLHAEERY